MAIPELTHETNPNAALSAGGDYDAAVIVSPCLELTEYPEAHEAAQAAATVDARIGKEPLLIPAAKLAGGRLALGPTGPLDRDYDDVRRFGDAARAAVAAARDAGARRPFLLIVGAPATAEYARAAESALLGALAGLWQPLEARETLPEEIEPVAKIGFHAPGLADGAAVVRLVDAVEQGRRLARDLCGADPERMAPIKFAQMCQEAFHEAGVRVKLKDNASVLAEEYPLLHAVARASLAVPRHRPCVIRLVYEGAGPIRETLLLAGKGVVYDTGGADIKYGGHMAGMSRDKGGAAGVAGFVKTVSVLRPKGLRVIAEIGAVRNSVGADGYVTDEIITSHAGARVRIGNTDAEGRLVMADLLSHLREEAVGCPNPKLFTVATLTGHAALAAGPYTIAIDNGPARAAGVAEGLAETGHAWGEPVELSRLRREDFDFVKPRTRADDVLSANNAPSSATVRGHQFPMAFLTIASGLDRHGRDGRSPLPYTHIDVAGSAVEGDDWQHGQPSGAPVVALAARYAF